MRVVRKMRDIAFRPNDTQSRDQNNCAQFLAVGRSLISSTSMFEYPASMRPASALSYSNVLKGRRIGGFIISLTPTVERNIAYQMFPSSSAGVSCPNSGETAQSSLVFVYAGKPMSNIGRGAPSSHFAATPALDLRFPF